MNFSQDIKEEAHRILNQLNVVLPAGIMVGQANPVFFVSEIDDLSIHAHLTSYDYFWCMTREKEAV